MQNGLQVLDCAAIRTHFVELRSNLSSGSVEYLAGFIPETSHSTHVSISGQVRRIGPAPWKLFSSQANVAWTYPTKHLCNIFTMLDQRQRRWADVVKMFYIFFVFTGMTGIAVRPNLLSINLRGSVHHASHFWSHACVNNVRNATDQRANISILDKVFVYILSSRNICKYVFSFKMYNHD